MSTHKVKPFKYISTTAVCLSVALLTGCLGVKIDSPADKSNVNNPVAASISLSGYCGNFHVALDGTDVTNQFTSPNASPATATFSNLAAGGRIRWTPVYGPMRRANLLLQVPPRSHSRSSARPLHCPVPPTR